MKDSSRKEKVQEARNHPGKKLEAEQEMAAMWISPAEEGYESYNIKTSESGRMQGIRPFLDYKLSMTGGAKWKIVWKYQELLW